MAVRAGKTALLRRPPSVAALRRAGIGYLSWFLRFRCGARVTDPTEGLGTVRGRVGSLLEVGTGFHPELTGRDNT